jgi:hypothetical protein
MNLLGDPAGLAEYQFRLALDLCTDCRDYHAIWTYRRLARSVSGIESTADIVGGLLRRAVADNGRILVAGAADAGMLALAAQATEGLAPRIDVADRCPTPLAVCRRYAETQGLSITTYQLDFGNRVPPQRYDAVLADCVLQFVPRESHVDVLRRLRETMSARGALVLAERVRSAMDGGLPQRDRADELRSALAAQRIKLPEDEASFHLRLNRMLDAQRTRLARCFVAADLSTRVVEAGFRIWDLRDEDRERTVVVPGGGSVRTRSSSPLR